MLSAMNTHESIVPLDGLARRLGLSKRWLHREASAGRIPSLKAGQRRLFNVDAVRRALAERASERQDERGVAHD